MASKKNTPIARPRFVAYYRVSTKKQGASGLGLGAQEAAVAAHVAATGGALLAPPYQEIESGKRSDRPVLRKALAHAKRARAILVVAKLDRLARNVAFLANLMEAGVDFVACDNPHVNRLTLHVLAAVAEDEARAISVRTKDALAAAKAKGTVLGAAGAANLAKADKRKASALGVATIKRNTAEAYADLRPMMADMAASGLSLYAIAKQLNENGELTRRGKPWNAMQVSRVLATA